MQQTLKRVDFIINVFTTPWILVRLSYFPSSEVSQNVDTANQNLLAVKEFFSSHSTSWMDQVNARFHSSWFLLHQSCWQICCDVQCWCIHRSSQCRWCRCRPLWATNWTTSPLNILSMTSHHDSGTFGSKMLLRRSIAEYLVWRTYVIPPSHRTPTFVIELIPIAHVGRLVGPGLCQSLCLNKSMWC